MPAFSCLRRTDEGNFLAFHPVVFVNADNFFLRRVSVIFLLHLPRAGDFIFH